MTVPTTKPEDAITGIQAMRGEGVRQSRGFWAEAWSKVIRRPSAIFGLTWIGIIGFFAIFAPFIASGHPVRMTVYDYRTAADAASEFRFKANSLLTVAEEVYGAELLLDAEAPHISDAIDLIEVELEAHHPKPDPAGFLPPGAEPDDRLTRESIAIIASNLAASPVLDETGGIAVVVYPILTTLTAVDWLLLLGGILGMLFFLLPLPIEQGLRISIAMIIMLQVGGIVMLAAWFKSTAQNRNASDWLRNWEQTEWFVITATAIVVAGVSAIFFLIPVVEKFWRRAVLFTGVGLVTGIIVSATWNQPPMIFNYRLRQQAGLVDARFTLVSWSPNQRLNDRNTRNEPPMTTSGEVLASSVTVNLPPLGGVGAAGLAEVLEGITQLPLTEQQRQEARSRLQAIFQAAEPATVEEAHRLITALLDSMPDGDFIAAGDGAEAARQAVAEALLATLPESGSVNEAAVEQMQAALDTLPLADDAQIALRYRLPELLLGPEHWRYGRVEAIVRDVLEPYGETFYLGTDALGQDVLSQMLHACRLSISIGLVSTGIAVLIGVTLGALMGYFGGIVDMVLYRVVEIFMAIPVLFLLIVAAGVLPKNTYVMMMIIGCFTWHGAARFTRAEFYRLRNQDFVQAAQATGLPLRSILFRHMLPNGITPVLVQASFAIAAAILAEATLSFLGLGPVDQPSWGNLLADTTSEDGTFRWWLAIFPGMAIFLTVLSYNLIGEALRDAIDPKLKKARV